MYANGFGHNLELKYIIQHLEFFSACTITERQVHVLHNPAMLGDDIHVNRYQQKLIVVKQVSGIQIQVF